MAIPKKLEELTAEIAEWSREFFGDLNPVAGTPLLVFTAKELRVAEARAEAAEQQLAEQRVAMLAKTGSLADECHLLREMLHEMEEMRDTGVRQRDEAQGRIVELERLVPDADFLDMLRDEFKYSLTPEYGLLLEGLAAAIREYREE